MTDRELLQLIRDAGPWVDGDNRAGDYQFCQWCDAYWGRRYPAHNAPSYVEQDDHDPDCLWLKVESHVSDDAQKLQWS
jgi:hypothetical protein